MTRQELNQYKARLQSARREWINSNPRNVKQVKQTYKLYMIARSNYLAIKGV